MNTKPLFLFLFIVISSVTFAQKNKFAYLPEFEKSDERWSDTTKKIMNDILSLNKKNIKEAIKDRQLQYFSISMIFIVDENGQVITNDIRFLSEIQTIAEPSLKYLSELPTFVPKKMPKEINKQVFYLSETYIVQPGNFTFREAEESELKQRGIKPNYVKLDEHPAYPGCGEIIEGNYDCVVANLYQIFSKDIIIPSSLPSGITKARVKFAINTDGAIQIMEIVSQSNDLKKEIRRIFKKVPDMIPGKVSGIPIRTSFTLPLTLALD